jgi:hypothetical protein
MQKVLALLRLALLFWRRSIRQFFVRWLLLRRGGIGGDERQHTQTQGRPAVAHPGILA